MRLLSFVMSAFSLDKIVRPNVAHMAPYSSARSEFDTHNQDVAWVLLDANENPFDTGYNRYPDPLQSALKAKLVAQRAPALTVDNLFLGNGSDEVIDLLVRAFCEPESGAVVIQPPTYGMYEVSANLQNAPLVRVPLNRDFQPDYAALRQAATSDTRLVFFCSPNNPTGNLLAPEAIATFAQSYHGIVVVDEAYIDFAEASEPGSSLLLRVADLPNLVVLHTFSKALGMAGIRVGMAWAQSAIITILNKIKPPYNLSQLAQQAALNALGYDDLSRNLAGLLVQQRNQLAEGLSLLPIVQQVYPSDANFLLVKFANPQAVFKALLASGIVVRDRSRHLGCEDCLRISVGTPDENVRLLEVLMSFAGMTPA